MVLVPAVSKTLTASIESVYNIAFQLETRAEKAVVEAEHLLLRHLGLTDWHPHRALSFVRSFSQVYQTRRIDADYFQPRYDDIVTSIKCYHGGWDMLSSLVTIRKCIEVGSEEYIDDGVPFVRVSNLSPFEITSEKYISEELYTSIQQYQPQQGEILLSKDATPGIAHYLRTPPRAMIPSGGILRLIPKHKNPPINAESLMLILNSVLVREQSRRDSGGSVILHWTPEQIAKVAIPILLEEAQIEIQDLVAESFMLHQQSKHLLECLKRAVEIAIEQSEQDALTWLDNEASV